MQHLSAVRCVLVDFFGISEAASEQVTPVFGVKVLEKFGVLAAISSLFCVWQPYVAAQSGAAWEFSPAIWAFMPCPTVSTKLILYHWQGVLNGPRLHRVTTGRNAIQGVMFVVPFDGRSRYPCH